MIKLVADKAISDNHFNQLSKKIRKDFPSFSIYTIQELLKATPKKLHEISLWFDTLSMVEKQQFSFMTKKYVNFTTKKEEYNAYDLAHKLNINVCPYCNRNYTFTTTNSGKNTRPDFDHFYSKEKYPILALSFYNLIPSCILCNSRLKGRDEFTLKSHLHPYDDSFDDYAKFSYKIKNSSFLYSESGFELKLESDNKRAENNKKDFALDVLYERHKDIVLELIQKREIYPDSYIDELLKNYEGIVFSSRDDLMRLITCGYVKDEDINKRPLSKLIKDISEELEFI